MTLSGADNAVLINAVNIGGKFSGSFKYKWTIFSTGGDFSVNIPEGAATLAMDMPMTS